MPEPLTASVVFAEALLGPVGAAGAAVTVLAVGCASRPGCRSFVSETVDAGKNALLRSSLRATLPYVSLLGRLPLSTSNVATTKERQPDDPLPPPIKPPLFELVALTTAVSVVSVAKHSETLRTQLWDHIGTRQHQKPVEIRPPQKDPEEDKDGWLEPLKRLIPQAEQRQKEIQASSTAQKQKTLQSSRSASNLRKKTTNAQTLPISWTEETVGKLGQRMVEHMVLGTHWSQAALKIGITPTQARVCLRKFYALLATDNAQLASEAISAHTKVVIAAWMLHRAGRLDIFKLIEVPNDQSPQPELTHLQREVARDCAFGFPIKETALRLGKSEDSIVKIRERAFRQLSVTSPVEALVTQIRLGVISRREAEANFHALNGERPKLTTPFTNLSPETKEFLKKVRSLTPIEADSIAQMMLGRTLEISASRIRTLYEHRLVEPSAHDVSMLRESALRKLGLSSTHGVPASPKVTSKFRELSLQLFGDPSYYIHALRYGVAGQFNERR